MKLDGERDGGEICDNAKQEVRTHAGHPSR
jgi:hypothetical protein